MHKISIIIIFLFVLISIFIGSMFYVNDIASINANLDEINASVLEMYNQNNMNGISRLESKENDNAKNSTYQILNNTTDINNMEFTEKNNHINLKQDDINRTIKIK